MIFGFCDIRKFTDCTECLQEEVMMFVNSVGEIIHFAVADNGGFPNKNIGDAFLVCWPTDIMVTSEFDGGEGQKKSAKNAGDLALKSFIRCINEIANSSQLKRITSNLKLQQRIPGYSTQMGFGLHMGWAIEGVLGSEMKIDCSYLSPHVNLSARLEVRGG